jgi:hypothetical protein
MHLIVQYLKMSKQKRRRIIAGLILITICGLLIVANPDNYRVDSQLTPVDTTGTTPLPARAVDLLAKLEIKGRAASTGYSRAQFGDGWGSIGSCDMRNLVLRRDMQNVIMAANCKVDRGSLIDPYTAQTIDFVRGPSTSDLVQIDHVVALSDAWQKGAQQLSRQQRIALANDPLELLAVSGKANQDKSNSDAASWLPPNKPFRCQYVARQVAIKSKYKLWVTPAEHDTIERILATCPEQLTPSIPAY